MFNPIKNLYPEVPKIEDIVDIQENKIEITVVTDSGCEKYETPSFSFMVYKRIANFNDGVAYECVCLELGIFHIKKDKEKKEQEIVNMLIQETVDLVAEDIRTNVFDHENDSLILTLKSDFMRDFWPVCNLFKLLHYQNNTNEDSLLFGKNLDTLSSMDFLRKVD